ncbi:50S ribosomal protein L9 [Candidatus Dependentiae bacterium]|nr:50S ribosomal protein L9 [Candidatus Dependentiae bacterium]
MRIFLYKDVPKVGMAGEIVKVKDGFALNFLFPQKLGVEVTRKNESEFKKREKTIERRSEVITTQTSMLAEKIKSTTVVIKCKVHDDGKLYGSLSPKKIVDALAAKGISVASNQVILNKSIKTSGKHDVIIKLSSRLKPTLTVKVTAEE